MELTGLRHDAFYEIRRSPHTPTVLLFPYDLHLSIEKAEIIIGRFSTSALGRISVLSPLQNVSGPILKIGAMCEFAKTSMILIGGDHRANLLNYTFGVAQIVRMAMDAENLALANVIPPRPTIINDNVLVSERAVVLAGVEIGERAVIGAGSVVRKLCKAFWSHGGVPSRPLRQCLTEEQQEMFSLARMADVASHHMPLLPKLSKQLMDGDISLSKFQESLIFLPARPRVHASISLGNDSIKIEKITGFSVGERMLTEQNRVKPLFDYFDQLQSGTETIKWNPDIFFLHGLYH